MKPIIIIIAKNMEFSLQTFKPHIIIERTNQYLITL
jgi:hypothetical protein